MAWLENMMHYDLKLGSCNNKITNQRTSIVLAITCTELP